MKTFVNVIQLLCMFFCIFFLLGFSWGGWMILVQLIIAGVLMGIS